MYWLNLFQEHYIHFNVHLCLLMSSYLFKIQKKTIFHLIFLLCLSIFVTLKGQWVYNSFTENNIPVYDGVMYQYQQIKRYELFNGDFSLINRYSQAVFEFKGNYVSAAYNSFITFFFPSLLKNDLDIFIRSIFSVFIFSCSIYVYMKNKMDINKLLFLIAVIFQFPIFYHYRVGLVSYIPELTCALILLSGYIFLLHFFTNFKFKFFLVGLILMLLPIGIRFNFFAYSFLFFTPIFVLYIKNWKLFDLKLKKRTLLFSFGMLIMTGTYVIYFLEPFFEYYTKTAYSYSTLKLALSDFGMFTFDYFSWEGFTIILLIILNNHYGSNELKKEKMINNLLLTFPFIVFFGFIILYLKSSNVPHIISAMSVFLLPVIFIRLLPTISASRQKIFNTSSTLLLITLVASLNISFVNNKYANSKLSLYTVQHSLIHFLSNQIETNHSSPTYLCFFEGMAEIPINVGIYKKTGVMLTNGEFFFNHDIFYKNGLKCQNADECFDYYLQHIGDIDYIIINSDQPKINLFPIAKKLNIKMQKYLASSKEYKAIKTIKSSFYGEIIIYKKLNQLNSRS